MLKQSATFFGRQYIPDLLLGVQTSEEVVDIQPIDVTTGNVEVVQEAKDDFDSKKEFLTPSELAERWRVHIGSVERWRREGKPPSFYTINGKILYKLAEIEDLESAKRQSN